MEMKSGSGLDKWRQYFSSSTSDIFETIEYGIMVAASDCPKEFRLRRDRIAETLFSCRLTRCFGCERVELALPEDEDKGGGACKSGFDRDNCEIEAGGSKESKVNSCRDDHGDMNVNQVSNYSFGEAEALTDEIEEENMNVEEVLRIKQILDNNLDETDSVLYDSLRRLQLMALSVDILKATEIGKSVNGIRKHGDKEIRHLARTLIDEWKVMVDEWVHATDAIAGPAEGTPDSVNPSVVDEEEGLPSPPLDEGAFFATQPTSIELSQFFDGMDDDGNPRNGGGEFSKNHERNRIKPPRNNVPNPNVLKKEMKVQESKKQEAVMKPNKPLTAESGPGRPPKASVEQKIKNETRTQKVSIQRRPPATPQDKMKCSDEAAVRVKLEASKRKLQERYQEAENAKKQRTVQVMELQDLPKQGLGHRNPHMKAGNHNRHWANGRR